MSNKNITSRKQAQMIGTDNYPVGKNYFLNLQLMRKKNGFSVFTKIKSALSG